MPLPVKKKLRDSSDNYIVIHNDGSINTPARLTYNVLKRRKLAYHYFIARDGKIYEFVNPLYRAQHAGISLHEGLRNWNDFSIGICLQGISGIVYTDSQYNSLQSLVSKLVTRYPDLKSKPLKTHELIARPFGRKNDPGPTFDMSRIVFQ